MDDRVKPCAFNFSDVKGISLNQLQQHYQLYVGYVKQINKIWQIESQLNSFPEPNPTYSEIRCLKLGESYALDGVKLHELYFENLGSKYSTPYGEILKLIERDFGSYKRWEELFKAVGLAMRGWAVLAIDPIDQRLHVFGSDAHDVGAIWKAFPLLVLDVYEHAYMIDFGIDRKQYIDVFMKNINWNVVNRRLAQYYAFYQYMLTDMVPSPANWMPSTYYPFFSPWHMFPWG